MPAHRNTAVIVAIAAMPRAVEEEDVTTCVAALMATDFHIVPSITACKSRRADRTTFKLSGSFSSTVTKINDK